MNFKTTTETPFDVEELLQHRSFLRALVRGLIADHQGVEDVLQDTWLKALERPNLHVGSMRAWLGRVARNLAINRLRTKQSSAWREAEAARPELQGESGLDAIQKIERQRQVLDALLSLPETRRTTLHLFYFEGLRPAQIASQMEVSVNTVHDRMRAGRADLKSLLDRKLGQDLNSVNSLGLYLIPLAGLSQAASKALRVQLLASSASGAATSLSGSALILGGILMTKKAVGLCVLFLALFGIGWGVREMIKVPTDGLTSPGAEAPFLGVSPTGTPASSLSEKLAENLMPSDPGDGTRAALSPIPTPIPSDLANFTLEVVWASDETPAAYVQVRVIEWGANDPLRSERTITTDRNGMAQLGHLRPGTLGVYLDRCEGASLKLAPGEHGLLKLRIPEGIQLSGRVRNANGDPVQGAQIWLSSYANQTEGLIVTESDSQGNYHIRDISDGRSICAWAKGYAPAFSRDIGGSPGDQLVIDLELPSAGGHVHGLVQDSKGLPIAAAQIRLDSGRGEVLLEDGTWGTGPPPMMVLTGSDGSFSIETSPLGGSTLRARAGGFATSTMQIYVDPNAPSMIKIELVQEGMIEGVVRNSTGDALEGVSVSVGSYAGFGSSRITSDEAGHFQLRGLESGQLEVKASHRKQGSASAKLNCSPGKVVRWNPVLFQSKALGACATDSDSSIGFSGSTGKKSGSLHS